MQTEMSLAVMAGVVLSLFLIVGEIAALRKRLAQIYVHMQHLHRDGRHLRMLALLFGLSAFFLVQPFLVALLVVLVMDGLVPNFSGTVMHQFGHAFAPMMH